MGHNRQYFGHNKPSPGWPLRNAVQHTCTVYSALYRPRVYRSGQSFPGHQPGQISEPRDERTVTITMFGSPGPETVKKSSEWERRRLQSQRSVKVGPFQFSMNFPEIMQYYARMRPGHLRLFDNKSEKLGQSQESSRWPGGQKIIAGGRILFFIFISPCSDKKMRFAPQPGAMWKLITLTNAVWGWE